MPRSGTPAPQKEQTFKPSRLAARRRARLGFGSQAPLALLLTPCMQSGMRVARAQPAGLRASSKM